MLKPIILYLIFGFLTIIRTETPKNDKIRQSKEPSDATRNKKTGNYTLKVLKINVKYLKMEVII